MEKVNANSLGTPHGPVATAQACYSNHVVYHVVSLSSSSPSVGNARQDHTAVMEKLKPQNAA